MAKCDRQLGLVWRAEANVDAIVQDYQEKKRQLHDGLLQQIKSTLDAPQYAKIEAALRKPPGQPRATPSSGEPPPNPPNPEVVKIIHPIESHFYESP